MIFVDFPSDGGIESFIKGEGYLLTLYSVVYISIASVLTSLKRVLAKKSTYLPFIDAEGPLLPEAPIFKTKKVCAPHLCSK